MDQADHLMVTVILIGDTGNVHL